MRNWEDIVKDKLEGYESPLPEGSLAEFRTRRNAISPARKRHPLLWSMAAATAVAAGLAAAFLLRHPTIPEDAIQVVQQPMAPVAQVSDSTGILEPIQGKSFIAQAVTPRVTRHSTVLPQETVDDKGPVEDVPIVPIEESDTTDHAVTSDSQDGPDPDTPALTESSPFIPTVPIARPIKIKIEPVAGLAMGSGLVAAVLTPMLAKSQISETLDFDDPVTNDLALEKSTTHHLPLKASLSTSFAITDRLNLTTGLAYSLYSSQFNNPMSGEAKQTAHYLGIPIRLDYTLFSYEGLDLYLGGGIEGDYCLAAYKAGRAVKKDGLDFSLLGTSGLQYHVSKRFGLFVEPEITWTFLSENKKLETYRTEHPCMFLVAGGLRIYVGK